MSKKSMQNEEQTPIRILLVDLAERDLKERARMKSLADQLNKVGSASEKTGGLSADQKVQLDKLNGGLDSDLPVDEFFCVVAARVMRRPRADLEKEGVMEHGLFSSQLDTSPAADLRDEEREIAAVCGLLALDNITDPASSRFVRSISEAQGEYQQHIDLFNHAFALFKDRYVVTLGSQIYNEPVNGSASKVEKGCVSASVVGCIEPGGLIKDRAKKTGLPAASEYVSAVSARNVAAVVRRLVAEHISADDPWLSSRLESAFNQLTGVVDGAPPSALEIILPDFEETVDIEIVKENLHAVQAIYFAYQLEEMRMFQVVERIVELFRQGLLPLGRGWVGDRLYKYYKKAAERITESERRDLYFRAFGAPGGNPGTGEPNRDFNELWLRFLSAVSSFARQLTVERMLRNNTVPMAVSQEQVRKAGRDLGANLSRNGYGIAYFAATEMQQSILEFRDVLGDPELRSAFGARDMWQVIEIVNANYLGGSRNTHRFRTQSRAGAIIIRWIANNVHRLSNVSGPVLAIDEIINPQLRAPNNGRNPTVHPTDWDLVDACEQWLAVGGVQEQSVEQYSQPIESPMTSSRPIGGMPQVARDALDAAGISLPA